MANTNEKDGTKNVRIHTLGWHKSYIHIHVIFAKEIDSKCILNAYHLFHFIEVSYEIELKIDVLIWTLSPH